VRGARLVSICSGAFALAAAGLLDGRPATTHWQVADELRRRYPKIDVRPNQL
jgi:transcriptional regulator GlxA family with amidase domain